MILNLSPELEARVNDWASKTGKPREELAVELLDEYFDESDTGRAISEAVRAKMFNGGVYYDDTRLKPGA